jgi:cytoskeletal protein CcmA (bactofilin family)
MFGKNKNENLVTLVSEETFLTGMVKTSNTLEVFGTIEAPVGSTAIESCSRVRVASNASVTGNIFAGDIIIEGTIIGNIQSTGQVKLAKGCSLLGDIVSQSLSIEDGVKFTGGVQVAQSESNVA